MDRKAQYHAWYFIAAMFAVLVIQQLWSQSQNFTLNAAWTLGLEHDRGSIEVGKRADLVLLDGPVEQIAYRFGHNPVLAVFVAGEPVFVRDDARSRCSGL